MFSLNAMLKKSILLKFFLGNFIPTVQAIGLVLIAITFNSMLNIFGAFILWIYLIPPILVRLLYFFGGRPQGKLNAQSSAFWVWYTGAQLQAIYLRFPFLEEILRIIPFTYSMWLRLWGSEIGAGVYWAPGCEILDRPHLRIKGYNIIGYKATLTSHLMNTTVDDLELIVADSLVESGATVGGHAGVGPGSIVCARETLPATMNLAPFYKWENGRRHSTLRQSNNNS